MVKILFMKSLKHPIFRQNMSDYIVISYLVNKAIARNQEVQKNHENVLSQRGGLMFKKSSQKYDKTRSSEYQKIMKYL